MADLALRMATAASDVSWRSVMAGPQASVRRNVIDTLGCAVAGSRTEVVAAVRRGMTNPVMGQLHPSERTARILGSSERLSTPRAAFINATAAHALELDETDAESFCHAGAVLVPTLLAVTESENFSDDQFLESVLVGYQFTLTLARWINPKHRFAGFHTTATIPTVGVAAAVARLRGGSPEQVANAIRVSCSFVGGTFAFVGDGANIKRAHAGKAAFCGVVSATLAESGVFGPVGALEGPNGLYACMAGGRVPDLELADFTQRWMVNEVGHKPYPSCRFCHASIDAAIDLHGAGDGQGGDIRDVRVAVSRLCNEQTGNCDPENELQRQFSTPYGVALGLLHGEIRREWYHQVETDALRLARRTTMVVDDALPVTARAATVTAEWADGTQRSSHIATPLGEPGNALSDARLRDKFVDLVSAVLPRESADRAYAELSDAATSNPIRNGLDRLTP